MYKKLFDQLKYDSMTEEERQAELLNQSAQGNLRDPTVVKLESMQNLQKKVQTARELGEDPATIKHLKKEAKITKKIAGKH